MGRLNLSASNPIKDGIDAFTALNANFRANDAADLAAAKDAREATASKLQNQLTQNQLDEYDNKIADRDLGALRMKIQAGTATPEELADAADQTNVPQGTPVQQGIPLAMPSDPRAATIAAAKSMAPSPLWKTMATGGAPEGLTKEDESERAILYGTFAKMNADPKYTPTLSEYKLLAREVVNNPAFADSDLASQHKALANVQSFYGQIKGITQPTQITDPNILESVNVAFPRIAGDSNLTNASINKLYIQPSPDGDPAKARLTIGVTGMDDKGEAVDGVVTHNRSSHPDDTVLTMTGGQWMSQATQKQMVLDGLLAAQAEHGNKEVLPIYEQLQANRATAKAMTTQAESMEDGTSKSQLLMEARLLQEGRIPAAQASAIADKFYAPIHKREAAKATHDQAIELEGLKTTSAEKMNALTNKTHVETNAATVEASKYATDRKERGDDKRQEKSDKRVESKEIKALNDQINTATAQLSKGVKYDSLGAKFVPMDAADRDQILTNLASYRKQLEALGVKTPAISIPVAAPPANRPPLSSFKR